MRIWHVALLPYLPDLQFKGQLRELIATMHVWRTTGSTNSVIINKVMDYPKEELSTYWEIYRAEYERRYGKTLKEFDEEFNDFSPATSKRSIFRGWHNKTYLRICMANLYEKYLGKGKSKLTDEEWQRLCDGYKKITGEEYVL